LSVILDIIPIQPYENLTAPFRPMGLFDVMKIGKIATFGKNFIFVTFWYHLNANLKKIFY